MNARVVEVSAESAGGLQYGTGFVVSPRLVLTARHVTADATRISVRGLGDGGVRACRPVWAGDRTDAALLEILDHDLALDPVRFGDLASRDEAVGRVVGFPRFQVDRSVGSDTEHVTGTIAPQTGVVSGRWQMKVTGDIPPSHWEGLSGAAVFTAGILIGIVTEALREFTPARLRVEPVARIAVEPGFADAWRRVTGTAPPLLEAADLDGILTTRDVVPRIGTPGALLRAEVGAVRFTGREGELNQLRRWCGGDGFRVHLVTGSAGVGKSRLALRLVKERRRTGEVAGTLRTPVPATGLDRLTRLTRPVLCVVDYAETRQEDLAALLAAVRDRATGAPLRVLLLARTDREWYDRFLTEHGLLAPEPIRLGPRTDAAASQEEAFAEAAHDLAAAIRRLPDAWPIGNPAGLRPPPDAAESPLALQAGALVGLLQTGADAVPVPEGSSVWEVLLRHERLYWDRAARSRALSVSPELRFELVAAAALCEPQELAEARRLAAGVLRAVDPLAPGPRLVADWLRDLYPAAGDEFWGGVRPDRLAEHAVMNVVRQEPDLLVRLLDTAPSHQAAAALTLVARAGAHRAEVAPALRRLLAELPRLAPLAARTAARSEHPAPLVDAIRQVLDEEKLTVDDLWALEEAIAPGTVLLADTAIRTTEALTTSFTRLAREDPDYLDVALTALNRHANRLSQAGREADALQAHTAAYTFAMKAAKSDDGHFGNVVTAAAGLTQAYSDAGHHEAALELTGALAELLTGEDAASPNLQAWRVTMLAALSTRLSAVGHTATALDVLAQAVATARRLTGTPVARGLLAMALESQARFLLHAGHPYDAVAAAQEAVTVNRASEAAAPGDHIGSLASSLRVLAACLSSVGTDTEALEALRESVELLRERTVHESDLPGQAAVLSELCQCLHRVGRYDEAVEVGAEQVAVVRSLASLAPERFRDALADALAEQAARLLDADHFTEARAAAAEAERLRDPVWPEDPPSSSPTVQLPFPAPPLYEKTTSLPETDTPAMPESPLASAIDQLTVLVTTQPEDAGLRVLLVQALVAAGRQDEALEHAQEAMRLDPTSAAAREAMSAALLPRLPSPAEAPEAQEPPEASEDPASHARSTPQPPMRPSTQEPARPDPPRAGAHRSCATRPGARTGTHRHGHIARRPGGGRALDRAARGRGGDGGCQGTAGHRVLHPSAQPGDRP
ncbi:trypsin-like peptidase domain-containing protein [Streptomyces chartreusis]|uniref:trypsin-like peptidase domain-containing protein n=1 Tax=Streptomyces chartreusis TaxID=1969 RepID=UPI0036277EB1